MKKKIIAICIFTALAVNTAFASGVSIDKLDTDWKFNEERTVYYVTAETIPDIEEEGYTVVKNASSLYESGVVSEDNVTVLKNDATGKKYRFIMQKKQSGKIEISNADVYESGKVIISGKIKGYDKVNVMILKPKEEYGEETWELKDVSSENMNDKVLDFKEVEVSEISGDKILEYQIPSGTACGTYKFVVLAGNSVASVDKYYMSATELETTLGEINKLVKEGTTEDIRTYIEKNYKKCYIDMEYYNKISGKDGKDIVMALMKNEDGFEDIDDVKEKFNENVIVGMAKDGKALDSVIDNYESVYGKTYITLEKFDEYKNLKNKELVTEALKAVESADELKKIFNEKTVLSEINEADPATIEGLIKNNLDYLDLSDDAVEYFKDNAESCVAALRNNEFKTSKELSDAIIAVKDNKGGTQTNNNKKPSESKPSSSGGGGYVAPSTQVPVEQPKTDVTVENKTSFVDLWDVMWAYDAIEYLYNGNIINGKTEDCFAPKDLVKREEFVKMIVNAFELSGTAEVDFEDANPTDWYMEFMKTAYANGVVKGITETEFGVGTNITKEDIAVMIYRAVNAAGLELDIIVENPAEISDMDDVSDYAKEAVEFMINKGAVKGTDGKFNPKAYATRAETAQMLYNIVKIR